MHPFDARRERYDRREDAFDKEKIRHHVQLCDTGPYSDDVMVQFIVQTGGA